MPAEANVSFCWEQELIRTTGISHTFKRAYEIANFLAGITDPEIKYRKALETIKKRGAVEIKQRSGAQKATVVLTRVY